MSRITRIRAVCFIAASTLLTVPIATAKKVADPPTAPIPTQVLTGKKVFISNSESTADIIFRVPDLTYNVLYEHMKDWGEYELVRAPADADLIFNINFLILLEPQLRLVVLDPKTHVVLWTFAEQVQPWVRQATGRKNFDQTMSKLVDDVRKLTAPPAASTEAPAPK
ncbi:MAG: hypothetical protein WAU58_05860 [Terriglobales bacterium]|jgi:hypothetical protein